MIKGAGSIINPMGNIPVPVIDIDMDPATKKLIKNLLRPKTDRAAWDIDMKKLFGKVLYNIGHEAARTARAVVMGGGAGRGVAGKLEQAHYATIMTRARNRNQNPLREYGFLGRNIRAMVDPSGLEVVVGVPEGIQTRAHHEGQGTLSLSRLALNLEEGFMIEITDASLQYFRYRAIKASEGLERLTGGKEAVSKEAAVWWGMFAAGKGFIQVAPRPFLRPSMEKAIRKFTNSGGPRDLGRAFERLWAMGVRPTGVSASIPAAAAGGE